MPAHTHMPAHILHIYAHPIGISNVLYMWQRQPLLAGKGIHFLEGRVVPELLSVAHARIRDILYKLQAIPFLNMRF